MSEYCWANKALIGYGGSDPDSIEFNSTQGHYAVRWMLDSFGSTALPSDEILWDYHPSEVVKAASANLPSFEQYMCRFGTIVRGPYSSTHEEIYKDAVAFIRQAASEDRHVFYSN